MTWKDSSSKFIFWDFLSNYQNKFFHPTFNKFVINEFAKFWYKFIENKSKLFAYDMNWNFRQDEWNHDKKLFYFEFILWNNKHFLIIKPSIRWNTFTVQDCSIKEIKSITTASNSVHTLQEKIKKILYK